MPRIYEGAHTTQCQQPIGLFTDGKSIAPAPDNSWNCPQCGIKKRARLRDQIEFGTCALIKDGTKIRYFVITNQIHGFNYEALMESWNRLMCSLRKHFRKLNQTIDYVWVTELGGKNGMVHRHGYFTRYVDQGYLSKLWKKATRGKSHHTSISLVRGQRAASYLTKYLIKQTTMAFFDDLKQKGMRPHRHGQSRNFPRPPKRQKQEGWTFHYAPVNRHLLNRSMEGCEAIQTISDLRQKTAYTEAIQWKESRYSEI